ncbi:MAG TPA: hypothetical protein DGQ94_16065 [Pseudomonas sp.]|nr:hypothetical protein [Pseudomonas sp.]
MKSKYRCLIEDILGCQQKLLELRELQVRAQERLSQADAGVSYQEESLRKLELALAEFEPVAAETAEVARKYTSANGAVELDLKSGAISISEPTGKVTLGDLEKAEQSTICIDPGQEVEPLRMGKVTFYGESARQIRAANAVLHSAGAGQLEVVKRANEPGEPYLVVDGQTFINGASAQLIDSRRFVVNTTIKTATTDSGLEVAVGLISKSSLCEQLAKNIEAIASGQSEADRIRQVIRDELKPGGMLHRG